MKEEKRSQLFLLESYKTMTLPLQKKKKLKKILTLQFLCNYYELSKKYF